MAGTATPRGDRELHGEGRVANPRPGRHAPLRKARPADHEPGEPIPDNYLVATGAAFAAKYRGDDSVAHRLLRRRVDVRWAGSTRPSTSPPSCGSHASSSSRTTSTPTRRPCPARWPRPTSPARRSPMACLANWSTGSTSSPCTRPPAGLPTGPEPERDQASSVRHHAHARPRRTRPGRLRPQGTLRGVG